MTRRPFFRIALAACLAAAGFASHAQDWPSRRPITLIVPFPAGGSTDATARVLAGRLGKELGQQVVVENKAGAGSNMGAAYAAKAQPDGYTLLLATSTLATNVSLYKNPGYDLRKDLIPVSQVSLIPLALMVPTAHPAKNLGDFIAYVKQKKGTVTYGSGGNGTSQHLSGALFSSMTGSEMTHVPYKGGAPANNDLMGGQIDVVFSPLIEVLGFIDGGRLRPLAVTTKTRSPRLPNVPVIHESLPGYEVVLWNGVFAPTGTPDAVVERLAAAVQIAVRDPAIRKTLEDQASIPVGNSPADFKKLLTSEIDHWARLVKISGATVD